VSGAKIDNEDLVFSMMDEGGHASFEFKEFLFVELAKEDAVLRVISETMEETENFSPSFVITDVIGNDVIATLHSNLFLAGFHPYIFLKISAQPP